MHFLLVAALSLVLTASATLAGELRLSHQWPEETDARDRAARLFAKEVQLRAPELSIRIYPRLSLKIEAAKQFEALQSGELDMSVYVPPYAVKQVPEFSLAALPGLYPSINAVRGLTGSGLLQYLQAVANRNGVHIVGWWWVPGGFVNTKREIAGPDTVRGLRLRGGDPLFDLMLERAGAVPVVLTSDRLYEAMKTGELDGTLTSYETFVSTKIYEHGKFFTAGSPGIWMFLNTLMISKRVWDGLSAAQRQAFEAAARISEDYFAGEQSEAERRFVDVFTKAGARGRMFSRDDYLAWLNLAQQTAWVKYLTISPEAETMLYTTIAAILANDLR